MNHKVILRRILCTIVLVLHFGGASQIGAVSAGGEIWKSIGLNGGKILSLAVDPNTPTTIYAGTDGGVMKTTNGGKDWNVVGQGTVPNTNTWVVTLDPLTPTTIYVMSTSLFKSIDSGKTWSTASNGISGPGRYVVINPQTPAVLYAGTWEGVYKSINGGQNWTAANTGLIYGTHLYYSSINALAVDPQTTDTIYAGTYDGGVFKSINGGETWSAFNAGLTDYSDLFVHTLVIDPSSPATLYVGTKGGLFKSINRGSTWIGLTNGLPSDANILSMAIDPVTPATLYTGTRDSGAFVSTNGGESWSELNNGLTDTIVNSLVIDAETPSKLYAGTGSSGVFSLGGGLSQLKVYLPLVIR
jgi:photosystem II stability/assembly factor-like uncharacterized protein